MRVDVIKRRAFKASLLRFTTFRGVMVPRESARPVESQKSSGRGKVEAGGLSSSNPVENSGTRIFFASKNERDDSISGRLAISRHEIVRRNSIIKSR